MSRELACNPVAAVGGRREGEGGRGEEGCTCTAELLRIRRWAACGGRCAAVHSHGFLPYHVDLAHDLLHCHTPIAAAAAAAATAAAAARPPAPPSGLPPRPKDLCATCSSARMSAVVVVVGEEEEEEEEEEEGGGGGGCALLEHCSVCVEHTACRRRVSAGAVPTGTHGEHTRMMESIITTTIIIINITHHLLFARAAERSSSRTLVAPDNN
jgi:hypothetical protein